MQQTITRIITGDEAPTAVTLLALLRSDTNATPPGVTLPISFTLAGDGITWTATFTDTSPAAPSYYSYTYRRTFADTSFSDNNDVLTLALIGVYCNIIDVRIEMGTFNEQVAADPDSGQVPSDIAAREQAALSFADSYINSRASIYGDATPLILTANPSILRFIAAKLAAWQLYRTRGLQDDGATDHFQQKYDWATDELEELLFSNSFNGNSAPIAVAPSVDPAGNPVNNNRLAPKWNGSFWQW